MKDKETTALKMKDLLGIRDLSPAQIKLILDTTSAFAEIAERPIKKVPTLRGKTVVNLFFEPSTRTRTSFELAAKRLSADVVNFAVDTSSITKGETVLDTARNIEAMAVDALVVRHSSSGIVGEIAQGVGISIINAGDGTNEHPTQALLDLFTIRRHKKAIAGLTVAILGDIAHSRVARSNIWGLRKLGARVRIGGPPALIPPDAADWGVSVCGNLEEALAGADVVMALRIQRERMEGADVPSFEEYHRTWGLTAETLKAAAPDAVVLHPGPINREVEISSEVADGERSLILEQVGNGVAIRMAVLYLLIGQEAM